MVGWEAEVKIHKVRERHPRNDATMILVAEPNPTFFPPAPVDRPIRSDSFDLPSAVCSTEPQQKSRIGKECQPKIFGLREKRKGKDEKSERKRGTREGVEAI